MPSVRIVGPIVWAASVTGLIYLGCASYSVRRDVKDYKQRHRTDRTPTLAQVDGDARWASTPSSQTVNHMSPLSIWNSLSPVGKSVYSLLALNTGAFGLSRLAPALTAHLAHTPVFGRNYTLLASTFAQTSALNFAFITYATVIFGLQGGEGRVFAGSGSHFLSFYLGASTISTLGAHLWSALPGPMTYTRAIPTVGAGGAIMSLLGSWLMANPASKIGIMFLPVSWKAEDFFWGLVAFETVGTLGFLKWLPVAFDHPLHLCGLGIGALYTTYDGKTKVWEPARNIAYDIMRRVGLV